jgi:DNA-binding LacI/PurR family transcriptional regulator
MSFSRPKLSDVARLAGVSPTTVSIVLNGRVGRSVRVSQETQDRIWDAVRQLGYSPNPVARSLAGGRNRLMGVFTYEDIFPINTQNFYYPFLVGIEEEAHQQDYDLLLFTRSNSLSGGRSIYVDGVNRLQLADGAILLGKNERRSELAQLHKDRFPFVFIGRRAIEGGEISYVGADYAQATSTIVDYLAEMGHRRITYFRLHENPESAEDRELGFRSAIEKLGLPFHDKQIVTIKPAQIIATLLLEHFARTSTTALVAENTTLARHIIEALDDTGMRVPDDCSMAVLGDPLQSSEQIPGMTTFLIPRREMGQYAVRLLADILSHPPSDQPLQVMLPCEFVAGTTVAQISET